MVLYFNPKARTHGARAVLVWLEFEEYLVSLHMTRSTDAPALICIHPEDTLHLINHTLSCHARTRDHHPLADRVERFLSQVGYRRLTDDTRGRQVLYGLRVVLEQEGEPGMVATDDVDLRRQILVKQLNMYHASDPAWLLPSLWRFRTPDSADGEGADGHIVEEMRHHPRFIAWTGEDVAGSYYYPATECEQPFEIGSGRRLPAQWYSWARWHGRPDVATWRTIGFPPQLPHAPWNLERNRR
jgi:hypothetical protein